MCLLWQIHNIQDLRGNLSYILGIPDTYTKVLGPIEITGIKSTDGEPYFYAKLNDEEIELEPGQVIGVEGAQIGYRLISNCSYPQSGSNTIQDFLNFFCVPPDSN